MVSISEFLERVGRTGEILTESIEAYFVNDEEKFTLSVQRMREVEHDADEILRRVKHDLYAYLLIPDTRSDVDRILNRFDDFIDETKRLLILLDIERPHIPEPVVPHLKRISESTNISAEALVSAGEAYFSHPREVQEKTAEVFTCEKEVDELQEKVIEEIYNGIPSLRLSEKMHITRFLDLLSVLSDICEDIGKDLVISALKRGV